MCRHARRGAASCAGAAAHGPACCRVLAQAVRRESRARQRRGRSSHSDVVRPDEIRPALAPPLILPSERIMHVIVRTACDRTGPFAVADATAG